MGPRGTSGSTFVLTSFLLLVSVLLCACSTPGPLHVYSLANGAAEIHDIAVTPDKVAATPSYLAADDRLVGFAYDPFTDHFFLRLAPGNRIRVVDRPARKIKREFVIEGIAEGTSGDVAVSPRDGHIFLTDSTTATLFETSRLGELIRRIALPNLRAPAAAVAFDMSRGELLVLDDSQQTIHRYGRDGGPRGSIELAQKIGHAIAYDSERHELYARLADRTDSVAVFNGEGSVVRSIPVAVNDPFIDVGPHSFFRMF